MIASGNNSHSEPANCPNFINPTLDPRSSCSNSLTAPPQVTGQGSRQGQHYGHAMQPQAWTPRHTARRVEGPCFPPEVSKSSQRG